MSSPLDHVQLSAPPALGVRALREHNARAGHPDGWLGRGAERERVKALWAAVERGAIETHYAHHDYGGTWGKGPVTITPPRPKGPEWRVEATDRDGQFRMIPPLPEIDVAAWRLVATHPDPAVPELLLSDAIGPSLWRAWARTEGMAARIADHDPIARPEIRAALAPIWPLLVERAGRSCAEAGVEVTALLDRLLRSWERANGETGRRSAWRGASEATDLPLGPGDLPQWPRLAAALAHEGDFDRVEPLLALRSTTLRRTVLGQSAGLTDPDRVLALVQRLDPETAGLLAENPALAPTVRLTLREWALLLAVQGSLHDGARAVLDRLLEAEPLGDGERRRLGILLATCRSEGPGDGLAGVGGVVRDPTLRPMLLRGNPWSLRRRRAAMAEHLHGDDWLALVVPLAGAPDPDGRGIELLTLRECLAATESGQLRGVAATALAPLLRHADREVRMSAMRLAGGARGAVRGERAD